MGWLSPRRCWGCVAPQLSILSALQPILPLHGGHRDWGRQIAAYRQGMKKNGSFICTCFVRDHISLTESYGWLLSAELWGSSRIRHWRGHLGDQEQLSKLSLCQKQTPLFISLKKAFGESHHIFFYQNISRYSLIRINKWRKNTGYQGYILPFPVTIISVKYSILGQDACVLPKS